MSDDRQAQAAAEAWRRYPEGWDPYHEEPVDDWGYSACQRQAFQRGVEWADAHPQSASGSTSDGYHTFNELYEYRMLYNAHAAHGWLTAGIPVVKSWRHADGEECFGGGWFVVVADLPAGQVSNHYKAKHWGLFKVPEVDLPPEWDGHTPEDAARRLRIEAEHTDPQPRTITRAQFEDAYTYSFDESPSRERTSEFLRALGMEVTDDE